MSDAPDGLTVEGRIMWASRLLAREDTKDKPQEIQESIAHSLVAIAQMMQARSPVLMAGDGIPYVEPTTEGTLAEEPPFLTEGDLEEIIAASSDITDLASRLRRAIAGQYTRAALRVEQQS